MIEDKNPLRTPVEQLGEFGLIDHITKSFEIQNTSTVKAIGDDAAVVKFENHTVVTTDMLVEGIHFDLSYVPLKHLGYKSIMVNLSDVYAMNAVATQVTVSIAISNRFPVEAVEELYEGIQLACSNYGVDLIGGDTTASTSGLIISVTALGEQVKDKIVYRSGAKDTDLLVVSGDVGAAYMGLQILEREKAVFKANPNSQPDIEAYSYLIERQLKPEARRDIPKLLEELDVQPTSMIDVSDGLSSEIIHLCKQSGVGMKLYEDKLPLDPTVISSCEEFNLDSTTVALSGGEDYELLFTIKQEDFPKIKANPSLSIIGHVLPQSDGIHLVTRGGEQIAIKAMGWNSFEN
ncbi:thiamine-phosphate kinase [Nonlabens marinus]|uniref:Thiamine-monophosphate kinase n=1 Tax=Nonlabens marinus S1-08 TaxID=1454201 RepID=W8VWQ6_9FLAO|nr:thiamine-phosphate kinase [Nonlabens marinus]BAO54952.1 thiamine-monophosphate kinase [Nonlabens marinus S1-08]